MESRLTRITCKFEYIPGSRSAEELACWRASSASWTLLVSGIGLGKTMRRMDDTVVLSRRRTSETTHDMLLFFALALATQYPRTTHH